MHVGKQAYGLQNAHVLELHEAVGRLHRLGDIEEIILVFTMLRKQIRQQILLVIFQSR